MPKYDNRAIEAHLRVELRKMRDADIVSFPGDANMESVFRQDYRDGLSAAALIGIGRYEQANDRICDMDTAAREAVAHCIAKVDSDFFNEVFGPLGWKHTDDWIGGI